MENNEKSYEAPRLTVVSFKTERGYSASSAPRDGFLGLVLESDEGSEYLESRNDDNHYFWGGDENVWN